MRKGIVAVGLIGMLLGPVPAANADAISIAAARKMAERHEHHWVHWIFGPRHAWEAFGSARVGGCHRSGRRVFCAVSLDRAPTAHRDGVHLTWTDVVGQDGPCPAGTVVAPGVASGSDRGWHGCANGPIVVISRNPHGYGIRPVTPGR